MYNLRFESSGVEAAPSLVIATSPRFFGIVVDGQNFANELAGELRIPSFGIDSESFGFDGVGRVETGDKVAELYLPLPKNPYSVQEILSATATVHFVLGSLNAALKHRRDATTPFVRINTQVDKDTRKANGHLLNGEVSSRFVDELAALPEADFNLLAAMTSAAMIAVAGRFKDDITDRQVQVQVTRGEEIKLGCLGASLAISDSPENRRLIIGRHIDTPEQQITLLAGIASMSQLLQR